MNQLIAFPFFAFFAAANAVFVTKKRTLERICLSAAIISAPWMGGVWIKPIKFDFRISYIFLYMAFALLYGKSKRFKYNITYTVIFPTVALILSSTLSSLFTIDSALAFGGGPAVYFTHFMYFFTIFLAVRRDGDADYILKSLFLGLFYTSVLALLQYKIRFFNIGFIDRGFYRGMFWRPRSVFFHPNSYGLYQLLVLPILFRQIIVLFKSKNNKLGAIYSILFLISSFTLYTTHNRGSWVGLAVGMFITTGIDFFRRGAKKTRKTMIRVLVTFCILSIFPLIRYGPRMYERMFVGRAAVTEKADSRLSYDADAYAQIRSHPLLGVGVGNLSFYSTVIFTHNLYLLILAEYGFVGFTFFLWYLLGFLNESRKGMKARHSYISNMGTGFMTTVIALLIASYPGPDYGISVQVSSHLWIIAGICVSLNGIYYSSLKLQKLKKRQQLIQQGQSQKTKIENNTAPYTSPKVQSIQSAFNSMNHNGRV